MNIFNKIKHSILAKILITTIISVIAINLILLYYLGFHFRANQQFFVKSTLNYITYVLEDIENNPTREKLEQIRNNFRLEIIIIPEFENFPQMQKPDKMMMGQRRMSRFSDRAEIFMQNQNVVVYNRHNKMFLNVKHNGTIYKITYLDPAPFLERFISSFMILISISFVMFLIFLYIKSLLKPLKDLNHGIEKIISGNLDYEVPIHKKDELGFLTASFNNMNKKIKTMLTSKEQLLFDVSHELRTPLTRIKLALALMNSTSFTESISDDVDELEIMINEILNTARGGYLDENLDLTDNNISDIVKTAIKHIKLKKNHYILNVKDDFDITADRKKMITVIKNIIENSIKYSNSEKFPIEINLEIIDNNKICTVSDKGTGIPEKDLEFVFEPFYRVDKARTLKKDGFGLGLHLCKKIIDLHNFRIQIESIEHEGTTVIIYF